MLRVVASAANEAEAEMIAGRLAGIGIAAVSQRAIGGPEWGGSGARNVYVEEQDLERARELLAADEPPFSDEELGRLSEEAGREPGTD
jgi:hypothetical protein